KSPLPDLIFLDIRMPELDGFEFLKELEAMPAGTFDAVTIYMLTSSLDDRDRMKALKSPLVSGFKNKPLTEAKLLEILEEMK
ncbi:MAG: response regulator, partial [Flavobacteriales bacterium]